MYSSPNRINCLDDKSQLIGMEFVNTSSTTVAETPSIDSSVVTSLYIWRKFALKPVLSSDSDSRWDVELEALSETICMEADALPEKVAPPPLAEALAEKLSYFDSNFADDSTDFT